MARRLGSERGVTLIELVVVMALNLVVIAAVASVLVFGLHAQHRSDNYQTALQTLQTSLVRMTNQLRPAASVTYVTGQSLLGLTFTPPASGATAVTYDCYTTPGTCVAKNSSGTTTATLATHVTNSNIFTLECRSSTGTGDLVAVANGGSLSGCANTASADYVKIQMLTSVPCTGQGNLGTCPNATIEVDGGTSLRNQS
jgi:type II secretory pathway pseudopilin PulG